MKRLLAVALLAATPLLGQTHSEAITVEVVDVPVYVVGPNGPISNLSKDDFTLTVNGKRQPIDYFDTIDFETSSRTTATTAAAAAPPRDLRDRRLFLILFDMTFSRPGALARAQKAALTMVRNASPADYFSVMTFSARKGAQFVTPFTNDAVVTARAVLKLRPSDARDPLGVAITSMEHDTDVAFVDHSHDVQPPDGKEAAAAAELQEILGVGADLRQMPAKRLIEDQVNKLADVSARLAKLEGFKHVIFLSEGFNSYAITGAKPNMQMHQAPEIDARLMRVMSDLGKAFRAAGAFVDTIDLGTRDASSSDSLVNESLSMIARTTGGQFIQNHNDIAEALGEVVKRTGKGYRLGFKMPADARKGDNSIDVKVRNVPASAIVSFRNGFSTTPATADASVDPLRLADVILNDTPQSGVPPAIRFGERPYLLVGVNAPALIAQNNGKAVEARVMLYIFDKNRNAVEFKEKKLNVPAEAKGELVFRDALKLGSGDYVAKALVVAGDNVGFSKQTFRIP